MVSVSGAVRTISLPPSAGLETRVGPVESAALKSPLPLAFPILFLPESISPHKPVRQSIIGYLKRSRAALARKNASRWRSSKGAEMPRVVRCGLIQARCEWSPAKFPLDKIKAEMLKKHERLIAEAARKRAQVVCLQELFYGPYFAAEQ